MPDELTEPVPIRGRCKECSKFVRIYPDLATLLYVSVTESWSVTLNRKQTCKMSHILECAGHAPTGETLSKHPDITWDAQARAFYRVVEKPIFGYVWEPTKTVVFSQRKRKTSSGVRAGKKRRVEATKLKLVRKQTGSKTVLERIAYGDLPDDLKRNALFLDDK